MKKIDESAFPEGVRAGCHDSAVKPVNAPVRYNYSEMEYDQNGNLTKDSGKNISQIDYNYLNLPDKITFNSGGTDNTIEWTYDAKDD